MLLGKPLHGIALQLQKSTYGRSTSGYGVDFIQIHFLQWHNTGGIITIVFEEIEVAFVDLLHQAERFIVKVFLHRVQPFRPMGLAFVESRYAIKIHRMFEFDGIENRPHAFVEILNPKNRVEAPAIMSE